MFISKIANNIANAFNSHNKDSKTTPKTKSGNKSTIATISTSVTPKIPALQEKGNPQNNVVAAPPATQPQTLMDHFDFQVKNQPNALACGDSQDPGKALTYQRLNAQANQLAHYLANSQGVKSGDRVVIMGNNQAETLIAMLAILKLGAAFVIIESHTSQAKINQILKESKASCMVLSNPPAKGITIDLDQNKIVNTQEKRDKIAQQSNTNPQIDKIEDSQLAYLLFTSGSTSSAQKAVMQTRKGLLGQMQNYAKDLGISSKDRLLQISHIAHDQALCNIFGALITGASLVFHDLSESDPKKVRETLAANKITIFTSISSVFSVIFSDADKESFPSSLRLIRLGGEAVTLEHLNLFCRIASDKCSFGIGYGATECSWIAYNSLTKQEAQQAIENKEIPLGKISSHITPKIEEVKDEEGSNRNIGELCISSPYLAVGYQENEEAQKAAFVTDGKQRYYRTGDYFEVKDGNYVFKGRKAWHVKINGQRVSLKEVEDRLKARFPMLEECVVIADKQEMNLYAFYKLKPGTQLPQNARDISLALASDLQPHEIPLNYFPIDEFPRLDSTKIDRMRLKELVEEKVEAGKKLSDTSFAHPVNKVLADLTIAISKEDEKLTFKELGIDSMTMLRFRDALNRELSQQHSQIEEITFPEILTNTIVNLKKLVNKKIDEKSFTKENPGTPLSIDYNYDYVTSKQARVHTFSFEDMNVLANHANNKYGINIVSCVTQEEIEKTLKEFKSNPNSTQMGIFFPIKLSNPPQGHFAPLILNKENGKLRVYLGDSMGGDFLFPPMLSLIDSLLSDEIGAEMFIDPLQRLEGTDGCASETLHWLIKGLRLKDSFTQSIRPLPRTVLPEKISDAKYKDVKLFLSAPSQLATAMPLNFETTLTDQLDLDPDEIILDSKKKISLAQHLKKHQKTISFHSAMDPTITHDIPFNYYLLNLSAKYKRLLKQIKSANSAV